MLHRVALPARGVHVLHAPETASKIDRQRHAVAFLNGKPGANISEQAFACRTHESGPLHHGPKPFLEAKRRIIPNEHDVRYAPGGESLGSARRPLELGQADTARMLLPVQPCTNTSSKLWTPSADVEVMGPLSAPHPTLSFSQAPGHFRPETLDREVGGGEVHLGVKQTDWVASVFARKGMNRPWRMCRSVGGGRHWYVGWGGFQGWSGHRNTVQEGSQRTLRTAPWRIEVPHCGKEAAGAHAPTFAPASLSVLGRDGGCPWIQFQAFRPFANPSRSTSGVCCHS